MRSKSAASRSRFAKSERHGSRPDIAGDRGPYPPDSQSAQWYRAFEPAAGGLRVNKSWGQEFHPAWAWLFRIMIFRSKHKGFRPASHEIHYFSTGCKYVLPGSGKTRRRYQGFCPSFNLIWNPGGTLYGTFSSYDSLWNHWFIYNFMGYPSETRIKPGRNDTTEKSEEKTPFSIKQCSSIFHNFALHISRLVR